LANILDRRNHKIGIPGSGKKAIAVSQKNGHYMVFVDMKLPARSGLEASLPMGEAQSGNEGQDAFTLANSEVDCKGTEHVTYASKPPQGFDGWAIEVKVGIRNALPGDNAGRCVLASGKGVGR
jgi:hypothetical protein